MYRLLCAWLQLRLLTVPIYMVGFNLYLLHAPPVYSGSSGGRFSRKKKQSSQQHGFEPDSYRVRGTLRPGSAGMVAGLVVLWMCMRLQYGWRESPGWWVGGKRTHFSQAAIDDTSLWRRSTISTPKGNTRNGWAPMALFSYFHRNV